MLDQKIDPKEVFDRRVFDARGEIDVSRIRELQRTRSRKRRPRPIRKIEPIQR
jgi:hypothetical protein